MATLTVQDVTRLGVATTYAACPSGGDKFLPSENTFLQVKNASGGALTVTVAAAKVPAPNLTITFAAVSIPATTRDKMIGPFPAGGLSGAPAAAGPGGAPRPRRAASEEAGGGGEGGTGRGVRARANT